MNTQTVAVSKTILALSALAVATTLLGSSAEAAKIKRGALVLRSGAVNLNASYSNEHRDANGKLHFVSALCSPGVSNKDNSAALIATDTTRGVTGLFAGTYGATQASTIINAGGAVVSRPVPGNPNHCEISGLAVAQIKGVWTMCRRSRLPIAEMRRDLKFAAAQPSANAWALSCAPRTSPSATALLMKPPPSTRAWPSPAS